MKKCSKCHTEKDLTQFANQKSRSDGKYPFCRDCEKKRELAYRRRKDGLVSNMYSNQISNSNTRRMDLPSYSLSEFKEWCLSKKEFHELYDKWVESDFNRRLCPSADRKDNSVSYILSNLEIVPFIENENRYKKDLLSGKISHKGCCPVVVLDEDMNVIERYPTIELASRKLGYTVFSNVYSDKDIKNRRIVKEKEYNDYVSQNITHI